MRAKNFKSLQENRSADIFILHGDKHKLAASLSMQWGLNILNSQLTERDMTQTQLSALRDQEAAKKSCKVQLQFCHVWIIKCRDMQKGCQLFILALVWFLSMHSCYDSPYRVLSAHGENSYTAFCFWNCVHGNRLHQSLHTFYTLNFGSFFQ